MQDIAIWIRLTGMEERIQVSAKAQAIIWAKFIPIIRPNLKLLPDNLISKGMHVLLCVQVQFSSLYGLSLVVTEIDPTFLLENRNLNGSRLLKG
jgi:exodeoxyribonuclease VII large subunit